MTGSTEAAIVIPIVAFVVLFTWLSMVFWADSHPRWGNSEVPPQPSSREPSSRPVVLPEGTTIPRPRVEGQGAPQEPARQGSEHATR